MSRASGTDSSRQARQPQFECMIRLCCFRAATKPHSDRVLSWLWPRRGWKRAMDYVRHRVSRLSGSPHSVALGFAVGVFASFTPFMGFHFMIGFLARLLLRGSLIASAFGTFCRQSDDLSVHLDSDLTIRLLPSGHGGLREISPSSCRARPGGCCSMTPICCGSSSGTSYGR